MTRSSVLLLCLALAAIAQSQPAPEPGLLFYLSGDHGLQADYAGGNPAPNFWNDQVKVLPGGPKGPYLRCGDLENLSYWAAGNIYAQRGTLSFYWRARDAVGPTPFPVFRVGYGDHSSWDMVWLRIDYNGKPGFDAFVTDINLNTEGSLWIDRVNVDNAELQRARLGGIGLIRNAPYPGHVLSWKFQAPATDQSVAVAVSEGTPDHIKLIAYNLDQTPVKALLTGGEIDPGRWEMTQDSAARTIDFERGRDVEATFAPRATTAIELKLVTKGVPYWSRPDLGIDPEDGRIEGSRMTVKVHSLGAVDAPDSRVVLRDRAGRVLATAAVPPLKAPSDLMPKTADAVLDLPAKADWHGGSMTVEMTGADPEITLRNNRVELAK